jgi:hypothetical protein
VTRIRTVALLARAPGLAVLRDALLTDPALDLIAVATHGRLPKAEGGGTRREVEDYRAALAPAGVPLLVVDPPQSRDLGRLLPERADLLVSVCWRSLPKLPSNSAGEYAEQVKTALVPPYAPLARLAVASVLAARGIAGQEQRGAA